MKASSLRREDAPGGAPKRHDEWDALCVEFLSGTWSVVGTAVHRGRDAYVLQKARGTLARGAALSGRERHVLFLSLHGHANKWIAAELGISRSTVSTLLERARKKLAGRVPERLLRALCRSSAAERSSVTAAA
jgi:DNA-binding CsgD family transcriptional regulator